MALGPYPYVVKRIVMQMTGNAGERLPVLVHRDTGTPLTLPMEWALMQPRANGAAANTIENHLRTLGRFEHWLSAEGLSLARPFEFMERFTPAKIDASLRPYLGRDFSDNAVTKIAVGSEYIQARVLTIIAYLKWVMEDAIRDLSIRHEPEAIVAFARFKDGILNNLREIKPTQDGADSEKGLSDEELQSLLAMIDPSHPGNPWTESVTAEGLAVRHRNQVIVSLMAAFGIRRGDLLKLYTTDVLVHGPSPVLAVTRRPDDPLDPRKWEPNAKTQQRALPLDARLSRMLTTYIEEHRTTNKLAKRTPYLFVGAYSGVPLSLRSISNVFSPLKPSFPGIHSHVLRHTHNNRLAELCRKNGVPEHEGVEMARYLNGWKSDNQGTYTKAHRRAVAQNLSLALQSAIFR